MKKILMILAIASAAALCMTGCLPGREKTALQRDPILEAPSTVNINFVELHNTTLEDFGPVADTPYTFISEVDIEGDNLSDVVSVSAKAVEGASEEDAKHFASAVLRHIGEAAADQYPHYEVGGPDSFGTFFNDYGINIKVLNSDDSELYTLTVAAGEDIPLDPDIETYEEEWREYIELYRQGQTDAE